MIGNSTEQYTNNSFTYTLLLDDFITPSNDSFSNLSFGTSPNVETSQPKHKFSFAECRTQNMFGDSCGMSEFQSPMKISSKKSTLGDRLRKSEGALTWGANIRRAPKVVDFLSNTEESSDDEAEFPKLGNCFPENSSSYSVPTGQHFSSFSLSSCFKQKIMSFEATEKNQTKTNKLLAGKKMVNGKLLRESLKGNHFDRAVKKLARLIENGRLCPV